MFLWRPTSFLSSGIQIPMLFLRLFQANFSSLISTHFVLEWISFLNSWELSVESKVSNCRVFLSAEILFCLSDPSSFVASSLVPANNFHHRSNLPASVTDRLAEFVPSISLPPEWLAPVSTSPTPGDSTESFLTSVATRPLASSPPLTVCHSPAQLTRLWQQEQLALHQQQSQFVLPPPALFQNVLNTRIIASPSPPQSPRHVLSGKGRISSVSHHLCSLSGSHSLSNSPLKHCEPICFTLGSSQENRAGRGGKRGFNASGISSTPTDPTPSEAFASGLMKIGSRSLVAGVPISKRSNIRAQTAETSSRSSSRASSPINSHQTRSPLENKETWTQGSYIILRWRICRRLTFLENFLVLETFFDIGKFSLQRTFDEWAYDNS